MNTLTINEIPQIDFNNRTELDKKYIQSLALALGVNIDKLSAIVGLDELKAILKNAAFDNFNPKSENYLINLHSHSVFSDGAATIEQILDEAQIRAEKSGRGFLIGITDHDCLSGAVHLVKTIAHNCKKYSNIRVMVGVEPCFRFDNEKVFKKPIPFDAIIYCINPFEKSLIDMFETYTNKNRDYSKLIMHKVNQKWNLGASYEESCKFHCLLKTGGSSGFLKFTRHYVEDLLNKAGIYYSPIEILEIFKPFYANQNGRATLATMRLEDVKIRLKNCFGAIGLAHPALLELSPKLEDGWDFDCCDNFLGDISYDEALKSFIKSCDLKFIELNYIYSDKYFDKYPRLKYLVQAVADVCKDIDVIATGGTDSHGNNFGKILEGRY